MDCKNIMFIMVTIRRLRKGFKKRQIIHFCLIIVLPQIMAQVSVFRGLFKTILHRLNAGVRLPFPPKPINLLK